MPHDTVFRFLNAQPVRTQETLSLGCTGFLGAGSDSKASSSNNTTLTSMQQPWFRTIPGVCARCMASPCVEFCESWGASGAIQYADACHLLMEP